MAERVPTGRSGRSSRNQTCLWVDVYSTPQREAIAAHSWRPRPPSRSGLPMLMWLPWRGISRSGYRSATSMRTPSSARRHRTSAEVPAWTTALVTSSLVRTTASSTMSAKPQPWRVSRTNERAVATDRETAVKLAAARAVITELLVRFSTCGDPGTASCRGRGRFSVGLGSWGSPRDAVRWSWCGRPSDACPLMLVRHRPGRTGPAWLDSRMQGYLPSPSMRMPVVCVSVRRCADRVRSCRTVMAWFRHGETLGRLPGEGRAGPSTFPVRRGVAPGPLSRSIRVRSSTSGTNSVSSTKRSNAAKYVQQERSTLAGGTQWSLAQRRGALRRARKADSP